MPIKPPHWSFNINHGLSATEGTKVPRGIRKPGKPEHKKHKRHRKIPGQTGQTRTYQFTGQTGLTWNFFSSCLCVFALTLMLTAQRSPAGGAVRLNNLGVAYMNQARIAEALRMFRQAEAQDPSLFAA